LRSFADAAAFTRLPRAAGHDFLTAWGINVVLLFPFSPVGVKLLVQGERE
jgi:hypothetical protein